MSVTSTEPKARSRIASGKPLPASVGELPTTTSSRPSLHQSSRPSHKHKKHLNFSIFRSSQKLPSVFQTSDLAVSGKKYLTALPTLFVGILLLLALSYIFTHVHPSTVANFILYQAYLPVLLLTALTNFFLFSFIFLNKKKGLFVSLWITLIFFLKFQGFILSLPLLILSASTFFGIYLVWSVIFRA